MSGAMICCNGGAQLPSQRQRCGYYGCLGAVEDPIKPANIARDRTHAFPRDNLQNFATDISYSIKVIVLGLSNSFFLAIVRLSSL